MKTEELFHVMDKVARRRKVNLKEIERELENTFEKIIGESLHES
jgi:hypothetical protein